MNFLKKHYKAVYTTYKKIFAKQAKIQFNEANLDLSTWVLYLQYLRDYYILKTPTIDIAKDPKIASLTVTLFEYESLKKCIFKYLKYIKVDGILKLVPINDALTLEEAEKLYQQEQEVHWNKFWDTVNQYILTWNNDITI